MNNLVISENIKTMTSLEVAELTNKKHYNILADIRDEINKLGQDRGQLIFQESEYTNNQNRKQPMYNITLDGVLQLGARYDAVIRFNLIQKVKELQEKVKVPTTFREALLLAAEQQEKIETLALENKELETQLDKSKEFYSIKRVAILNGVDWRIFSWRKLKEISEIKGVPIKKIPDANYLSVNVYHHSAWEEVYPEYELD